MYVLCKLYINMHGVLLLLFVSVKLKTIPLHYHT